MRLQIRPRAALGKTPRAFFGAKFAIGIADKINRTDEPAAINHDLDEVAFLHLADGAAGQRLG